MRQLRFACGHSLTIFQCARVAIDEIGRTKGFKKLPYLISDLSDERVPSILTATATSAFDEDRECIVTTITTGTCTALFFFRWPDLRLLQVKLTHCACPDSAKSEPLV